MENWKIASEEFARYEVSDLGRVRVIASGRFLKIHKDPRTPSKNPYYGVYMLSPITSRYVRMHVHVLVARCFVPNPCGKPQVNHKFGVKIDNRASELEWMTCSENIKHSFLMYPDKLKGERNNNAVLTDAAVEEIRRVCVVGSRVNRAEMATKFGVSEGSIRFVVTGWTWKHLPTAVKTVVLRGETSPSCKFSDATIVEIRKAYKSRTPGSTYNDVAREFHCSPSLVCQVVHRKNRFRETASSQ
jgi:NUMOD4 motif-containing protein